MGTFSGKTSELFVISDDVHISGVASGSITVHAGGDLRLSGSWSGPVTVLSGGKARISGSGAGALAVAEGGFVELSGTFKGTVIRNEGTILVPIGAHFGALALQPDGSLARANGSIMIDDLTLRLRMFGTHSDITFG